MTRMSGLDGVRVAVHPLGPDVAVTFRVDDTSLELLGRLDHARQLLTDAVAQVDAIALQATGNEDDEGL
jgi:hypothetical protein